MTKPPLHPATRSNGAPDLTGRTFARWTVLGRAPRSTRYASFWRHTYYRVRCACGHRSVVTRCSLVTGRSRGCASCGARARVAA
jgi:hypothetical protein